MIRRKAGLYLVLGVSLALATSAQAQLFGKREPVKVTPPEMRVPELLKLLKEDGDENKRLAAIDELRGMDAKTFPEIVPALVELLLNDKKPSVRAESAYTLGRYRPVQQLVGVALESARDNDASMRVRLQARGSLVTYYLAGFRAIKPEDTKQGNLPTTPATTPSSKEPPLANPTTMTSTPLPVISTTGPRLTPVQTGVPMTTKSPNLPPAPPPVIVERRDGPGFQPLPRGPDGPDLGLPKP